MSARTASFVACRILAILFLLTASSYLINVISVGFTAGPQLRFAILLPFITNGLLHFLFAGFLWRNADSVGAPAKTVGTDSAMPPSMILRMAIAVIAIYAVSSHLSQTIDFVIQWLYPSKDPYERMMPTRGTVGDATTFVLALITIPVALAGSDLKRALAYPRSEPLE